MKITSASFPVLAFVLREDSSVASFDVFRALPALDELRCTFKSSGCESFGWRLLEWPLSLVLSVPALLSIVEAVAWSAEPLALLVAEARSLVPVAPERFGGAAEGSGPVQSVPLRDAPLIVSRLGWEAIALRAAAREAAACTVFGSWVLDLLQETEDWGADTLNEIAHRAQRDGLARGTQSGDFARVGGRLLPAAMCGDISGAGSREAAAIKMGAAAAASNAAARASLGGPVPASDALACLSDLRDCLEESHAGEHQSDHFGDGAEGCSYCAAIARADSILASGVA